MDLKRCHKHYPSSTTSTKHSQRLPHGASRAALFSQHKSDFQQLESQIQPFLKDLAELQSCLHDFQQQPSVQAFNRLQKIPSSNFEELHTLLRSLSVLHHTLCAQFQQRNTERFE